MPSEPTVSSELTSQNGPNGRVPRNGGVPLRVVIVHWNQVGACLDTVARFTDREVPVRVTVVDNGSEAGPLAELRRDSTGSTTSR